MPNKVKRHPLNQSRFYRVRSRAKLADIFGLTRAKLDELLAMERPYSKREMVTKSGKTRTIQEPRGPLRPVHARVSKLLSRIEPPDFLFCPVKARSYVSNAAYHSGAQEIRKLDIQTYFPSTPSNRVYWFFYHVMECSPDVADILAKLLTVNGHLATGSTVSPILSFFAFYNMWLKIAEIAKSAGCKMSVYIDDITLSGRAVPERVVWEIKKQVHSRGLTYHKEKRYFEIGEVTGAIIGRNRMRGPNRQHKKAYVLRGELARATDPAEIARLGAVLKGLREQRRQVEAG